jgi:hypothetical protein
VVCGEESGEVWKYRNLTRLLAELIGRLWEAQKTRILIGLQMVEARFMKFQMGIRTVLGIELEAILVTFWQRICLCFVCVLTL